ncbi:MAG: DUF952 domain-containing protein [Pseudomonadota bacterium]
MGEGANARDIELVVKVMPKPEWQRATASGTYSGSVHDARDGFIHLSTPEQLAGTLEKHYKGQTDLVAITYSPAQLGDGLKWEISRGGERFPHLYGMLQTNAALSVIDLTTDDAGVPQVPASLLAEHAPTEDTQS